MVYLWVYFYLFKTATRDEDFDFNFCGFHQKDYSLWWLDESEVCCTWLNILHEFGLKGLSLPALKQDYRQQQHYHRFAAGSAESLDRLQKVTSAERQFYFVWRVLHEGQRVSLCRCLLSGDSAATALPNEKTIPLPPENCSRLQFSAASADVL